MNFSFTASHSIFDHLRVFHFPPLPSQSYLSPAVGAVHAAQTDILPALQPCRHMWRVAATLLPTHAFTDASCLSFDLLECHGTWTNIAFSLPCAWRVDHGSLSCLHAATIKELSILIYTMIILILLRLGTDRNFFFSCFFTCCYSRIVTSRRDHSSRLNLSV